MAETYLTIIERVITSCSTLHIGLGSAGAREFNIQRTGDEATPNRYCFKGNFSIATTLKKISAGEA